MELHQIECANCGASLNIKNGETTLTCKYCGSEFVAKKEVPQATTEETEELDVAKKYEKTKNEEGVGNYEQVVKLYDELLVEAPDIHAYCLLGKAFAEVALNKENLYNLDKFKSLFEQGLECSKDYDKLALHCFILDKWWCLNKFFMRSMLRVKAGSQVYVDDMVAMNNLIMYVNDFVSTQSFDNPPKTYIYYYKELKDSISLYGGIICRWASNGTDITRKYLKSVKKNVEEAKNILAVLNKKYY